jgi:hypothetical protein
MRPSGRIGIHGHDAGGRRAYWASAAALSSVKKR